MKRRSLLLLLLAVAMSLFAMTAFAAGISVGLADASVNVGEGVDMSNRLTVTYSDGNVYTDVTSGCSKEWSGSSAAFSRNGSVVTGVEGGRFGTVSVNVRFVSGTDIYTGSDSATVNVYDTKNVGTTKVTLSRSSMTLRPNSGGQLTAWVYPSTLEQKFEWKSSDSSIASVSSSGYVTTYSKAGTATITATWSGKPDVLYSAYFDGPRIAATTTVTVSRGSWPYPPRPYPGNIPVTAISLPASLSVPVGGTQYLPVTYYPANTTQRDVNYVVRDPSIASVSYSGMVTGKSNGTTDITVYSRDNTRARATCRVTVSGSGSKSAVSSVSVSPSRLSLAVGDVKYLDVFVSPNSASQNVTFSSTKPSVASVDGSGCVRGKKAGTATIYVRSASNRNKYATVSVTVGKGGSSGGGTSQRARSVVISPKTLSLSIGETDYVSAYVTPSGANQSVTYSVGNPRIATVDANGNVKARAAGKTTVYAYSSVNRQLYATCIVTVAKGSGRVIDDADDQIGSRRLNGVTVPAGQVSAVEVNNLETDAYVVDGANKLRRMSLSLTETKDGGTQLCVEPAGSSETITLRMTSGSINDLLDEGVEELIVFNGAHNGAMTFVLEDLISDAKTAARRSGTSFTGSTEVSISMVQRDSEELSSRARRALNKLDDTANSSVFETGVSVRTTKNGKLKAYDITKRMPAIEISILADEFERGMVIRQCKLNKTTFVKSSTSTVKLDDDYFCTALVAAGSVALVTLD